MAGQAPLLLLLYSFSVLQQLTEVRYGLGTGDTGTIPDPVIQMLWDKWSSPLSTAQDRGAWPDSLHSNPGPATHCVALRKSFNLSEHFTLLYIGIISAYPSQYFNDN